MKKIIAVLFLTAVATVQAQEVKKPVQLGEAQKVETSQTAASWSQVGRVVHFGVNRAKISPKDLSVSIQASQAPATIEVTYLNNGQNVYANFVSAIPIPGATVAFRATLPNGDIVNLDSYKVQSEAIDYTIGAELWNGPFPGVWPSGWTLFEAIAIIPGKGVTYVSSYVAVRACCASTGPIQRVDLSQDGNTIGISGGFIKGQTVAKLDWDAVDLKFSSSSLVTADVSKQFEGEHRLTVCSVGSCSTRLIYVSRPPTPPSVQ
jgi:hypothetical protein